MPRALRPQSGTQHLDDRELPLGLDMAADAALPLCRHGTATGGVQEWLVMTGHPQLAPDRFSRSASDSEQGAVLHRPRNRMVCPARRIAQLGRPEREMVWLSGPRKRAERPVPPCSMPAPRSQTSTCRTHWTAPAGTRSGHLSKSATGLVHSGRGAAVGQFGGAPRRSALQRHSRSAPAGVYDLIAPATGYCATASCVRITYRSGLVSSIYHRAQQRPLLATAQNRPPVRHDTHQLGLHVGHEKRGA
jgi:hypothetical protein